MITGTLDLPRSGRLACWLQALVEARVSLDDALAAITAGDAAHHVAGLTADADLEPLALALGRLRATTRWTHAVIPVAGDPAGLAGPAAFNTEAIEVGEGVVLGGTGRGVVPHAAGAGVVWQVYEAAEPPPHDVAESHRCLRRALVETADALAALDVARWSPDAADALLNLRRTLDLDLPPGWPAETATLAVLAVRCRAIVAAALADDGAAVSASEAELRAAALQPLARASRAAIGAACSGRRDR
ncbi:MAG: hypothetical protein GEU96_17375 [Propionibacteriales bacterium]|nr:hypothetical protein [Propionibacteriales bacterium]